MTSVLDPDHPLTALRYLKSLCPDEDISQYNLKAVFDADGTPHDDISCIKPSQQPPSKEIDLQTYVALTEGRFCSCGFYRGTPVGKSLGALCSMSTIIRLNSLPVSLCSWPELYRLLLIATEAPSVLSSHIDSPWVSDFVSIYSAASDSLISSSINSVTISPLYDAIASYSMKFSVTLEKSLDFANWSQLMVSSLFELKDLDSLARRRILYGEFDSAVATRSGAQESVLFSTKRLSGHALQKKPGGLLFLLASVHSEAISGGIVAVSLPSEVVSGLDALFSNESFYTRSSSLFTQDQVGLAAQLWSDSPSDPLHSLDRVARAVEGLS